MARPTVPVGALTFGYLRNLDLFGSVNAGLGADVTVYQFGASLREAYGDMPVSAHAFLRAAVGTPARQRHAAPDGEPHAPLDAARRSRSGRGWTR